MIILIGGESRTGKTLLAQKLLEIYKAPYLSLDHLKMGLYKGSKNCGFTPFDEDEKISAEIWPIAEGIIQTCLENNQNIIIEGAYFPPKELGKLTSDKIIAFYLILSKNYIERNFDKISLFENIIEKRKFPSIQTMEDLIRCNSELKKQCLQTGAPYFEISADYEKEINVILKHINTAIST